MEVIDVIGWSGLFCSAASKNVARFKLVGRIVKIRWLFLLILFVFGMCKMFLFVFLFVFLCVVYERVMLNWFLVIFRFVKVDVTVFLRAFAVFRRVSVNWNV